MTQQTGTGELLKALGENPVGMYKEAYGRGLSLSAFLEEENPTDQTESGGLDAFERLFAEAGIITRSDWVRGIFPTRLDEVLKRNEGKALLHEFAARQWRKMYQGNQQQRAVYLSTDGQPGSWQTPYAEAQTGRWDEIIQPAIPLQRIVAMTTPIIGEDYRAFYLTNAAAETRMYRVEQGTDLPVAILADAERTIQLHKYGRRLRATYEQLRRMRIDKFAFQIRRMAIQAEIDKLAAAIDIAINGDGNANTAATSHDLTTLDAAASAGTLTLKGWLAFKLKFANPYLIDTALMQEAVALQLQLLDIGSANVPLVQVEGEGFIGTLTPINQTGDAVGFGWTTDAPALTILGLDSRMALDMVVEIGSDIAEMERFIGNQTEEIALSEVMGFAVLDQNASHVMDVNA